MNRTRRCFISLLLVCACASDDDNDDGIATTQTPSSQSSTQATSSTPETGDSGSDGVDACTSYIDTFEGCGINGCAAGPTNLNGTVFAGGACADATECSPTLCTCASDASKQWYAASCGCDACMDADVACERTEAVACP